MVAMERSRSFAVDDFTRYMLFEATREAILNEFFRIVVPELEAGAKVHIVSHSWGTVVAYEGLRRLDSRQLPGRVSTLVTAGSALSIGAVQSNLFGRVGDGRTPKHVETIINVDAGGDVVGAQSVTSSLWTMSSWAWIRPLPQDPLYRHRLQPRLRAPLIFLERQPRRQSRHLREVYM